MNNNVDFVFCFEDMDDSSFCQQNIEYMGILAH